MHYDPPPPLTITEAPVHPTGASAFPRQLPAAHQVSAGHKGCAEWISHDGGSHVMFFLSPRAARRGQERRQTQNKHS